MKKTIIVLSIILIVLAVFVAFFMQKSHRKVSDFNVFPCNFASSDTIEITDSSRKVVLNYQNNHWQMTSPVNEVIDPGAEMELKRLLFAKTFIDEKQTGSEIEKANLETPNPTKIKFSKGNSTLCELQLGKGYMLPTADSERRWVLYNDEAYRIFIPLMDFGPMFEQPTAGWRNKIWLNLTTNATQTITFSSGKDEYKLDRKGDRNSENPQGWRLVSGQTNGTPVDLEHFELDYTRIATVIAVVTPLSVEDWADNLSESEIQNMQFGGKVTLETDSGNHEIFIGPEADLKAHPEWAWLGEGSRYVRLDQNPRIAIFTSQHLYGLFPSLNDMRSKKIWNVDTTHFAGIEVASRNQCLRYGPQRDGWSAQTCIAENSPQVDEKPLSPTALGNYAKLLTALEAFRYAVDEEADEPTEEAEIRIYEDEPQKLTTILKLSEARKSNFRYARVIHVKDSGETTTGPLFVLTETICRLLLEDLRTRK